MILKINVKQFVDTTLTAYSASIGTKALKIEIDELKGCAQPAYELNPGEEGWELKVNSLDAAFQALSLIKQGASRFICGRHEAVCTLRILELDIEKLSLEDAFKIRDMGFNALIANSLDNESMEVAKCAQIKVLRHVVANVDEIEDYQTYSEYLLEKLKELESGVGRLIFELPSTLFYTADLFELVVALSRQAADKTFIAFPANKKLFEKLELDPYRLTKNLLPKYPDFLEHEPCWQRLNCIGVEGSIVNCGKIPTSNAKALQFGHAQFLPNWKESALPANIAI